MQSNFRRLPACMAVLAAFAAFSAQAQTTPTAADAAAPAKADSLAGSIFNTPTSSNSLSQSSSASGAYDLAGIGRRTAAQETILTAPANGLPIRFENGVFVYPMALVGVGHNDNLAGTNLNPKGSTQFSLQPRVVAELKNKGDRYTLTYLGNFTRYASSAADNFNTHDITAAGDNYFSARSKLGWSVGYIAGSDPRGSSDRGLAAEPDRWTSPIARGVYVYGANGAQGRFEVEGTMQSKRYDNNRATTIGSDVDLNSLAGRFFYRVMPRTSLVFEARHTDANYKLATSLNDNVDQRLLVGVTWDATAKTSGTFKVGHLRKNFSSTARQDASGSTWEGSVRWSPLSYSVLDFTTGRTANDSTGIGEYVINTGSSVSWNHQWNGKLSSRVTLGTSKADFVGATRSDNTTNTGLGVFYVVGRNMRAGLELAQTRRNSNSDAFDYKRNTTFLSLEGSL